MLFLLDIHQNILSASALLKCCTDCFSKANIVLRTNSISIEFYKNSNHCQFNIVLPENFLCPKSVSLRCKSTSKCALVHENNVTKLNFDINNSELKFNTHENLCPLETIFRFQISNKDVIEKCILKKSISPMYFKDVMQEKCRATTTYKIICTNCGSLLTENFITFDSVHKYYDCKSELDESSFCHRHDNSETSEIKANNTLYIDDMYFYFHHSTITLFKLTEKNKTYKCTKCLSTLSFQKKMDNLQYIGFFSDKIMLVISENDENNFEKYKADTCLLSFYSIVQELIKISISPKLFLQSKVDEKTDILLLWINSEKVVQFLLQESDEVEIPANVELKGKEVFKVLYCLPPIDSELSKKWKHDFSVEFFQISDNMMTIVKHLLQKSSDYFSEWQDSVKGFTFGYLPTEIPIL